MIVSYAQQLEDVLLYRAVGHIEKGRYIDLGANDPTLDSVTKVFYDKGWEGINVEPSQTWFAKLVAERPRDVNLCLAVSDKEEMLTFHEIIGTGLSTLSDNVAERHVRKGFERTATSIRAETLAKICEKYVTGEIHFLKVDVEGHEEAALRGADFRRFRPWIVVIEATVPGTTIPSYENWEPILVSNDYQFALFDGLNRFYVAIEKKDLLPKLQFPADDYVRNASVQYADRLRKDLSSSEAALRNFTASTEGGSRTSLTPFNPSPSASTPGATPPTFGDVSGSYFVIGRICFVRVVIEITNDNSGSGGINVNLPIEVASTHNLSSVPGRENGISGRMVCGTAVGGTKQLSITFYDGSYPGSKKGSLLSLGGWYET